MSELRSIDRTTRHRDTLTYPCSFEGQADLTTSETFLRRQFRTGAPVW
ncbi:hypothetical protein ACFQE1_02625 [Halobium palmae]|uniref:Uncharacterized protein n=1 Tax=Halobium palmae TaxID=1776492 RepID=A0ABD5RVC3_9EURY